MRAYEFLSEDEKVKNMVIRRLKKTPDTDPIFSTVYKNIIGEPLGKRMENYISVRGDQDAIKASKWLLQTIPTLGDTKEVKDFISKFSDPKFDPINVKAITPSGGMTEPKEIMSVITDPFAQKLFTKIFHDFSGKNDAGPGEAALAILSPNITYSSPGDIAVNGVKVEVKASRVKSGGAGRIWDSPINQKPMLDILAKIGKDSYSVLAGEQPFPEPELAKPFIKAVSIAWFDKVIPEIVNSFEKPGFKNIWHRYVFETYKEHNNWTGMLALGLTTYQYIISGDNFAKNMKKADHGALCRRNIKQVRELAPKVFIS